MQPALLLGEFCLNYLLWGTILLNQWDRQMVSPLCLGTWLLPLDASEAFPFADSIGNLSNYSKRPVLLRKSYTCKLSGGGSLYAFNNLF